MQLEPALSGRQNSIHYTGCFLIALALLASMIASREARAMHGGCSAYCTTETALIRAVRSKDASRVSALLAAGVQIDDRDEYAGRTALMWAAEMGCPILIRVLLNQGADPSLTDDDGNTALTIAKAHGNTVVTQLLQQSIRGRDRLLGQPRSRRGSRVRVAAHTR